MRIKALGGVCFLGLALTAVPATAQLRAEVSGNRIVVKGVSGGGEVAVLGVVDSFPGIAMHVVAPFLIGRDDDGDGQVAIGYEEPLGGRAVFVAVDLTTGGLVGGAMGGRAPEIRVVRGVGGVIHEGSKLERIGVDLRLANMMLVRPGVGAWRAYVGDGGRSDSDGVAEGTITLVPESFTDLDDPSAGPGDFEPGDVIVAIDVSSAEVFTMVLGDQAGGGEAEAAGGER